VIWEGFDMTFCAQDIGCCFGQDTRQLILDGVPANSITSTDLTPDYWYNVAPKSFLIRDI
jgi:hypothetical protein